MIEPDTVKLLRECDAGIKMGVSSIDDVLNYVENDRLKEILINNKHDHEQLGLEVEKKLRECGDEGKEPSAIAKGMSWIKSNLKLELKKSDKTVADLITDGCDMGVKSLSRYLNQYKAADEESKDIAKRLILLEEKLGVDIRGYL